MRWGKPPPGNHGGTHLTLPAPTDQVRGLKAHVASGLLPLPHKRAERGQVWPNAIQFG